MCECVCNNKIKVWVEIMLKKQTNKTKQKKLIHAHDLKSLRGPKEYNIWSHLIKKKNEKRDHEVLSC